MGRVVVGPRDTRSPAACMSRVARSLAVAALGLGAALSAPPPAQGAPEAVTPPSDVSPEPVVRDPNEQPPLPPPNGQPAPDSLRRDVDHTSNASWRRRVMLNLSPVYASFRLPFLGRPNVPRRGGGVGASAQVALWRPFGLRATVLHTVHAAYDEYTRDDEDNVVQTAGGGTFQSTHAGLSVTYTMDLGRVITTLDAGAGGMWIRSPDAIQDGQLGATCRPEGVCDTGLSCSSENICEVGLTPQIHGGFALDVLVGDRFTVGSELRYFALITAPTSYPVYLVAALRAGIRF